MTGVPCKKVDYCFVEEGRGKAAGGGKKNGPETAGKLFVTRPEGGEEGDGRQKQKSQEKKGKRRNPDLEKKGKERIK